MTRRESRSDALPSCRIQMQLSTEIEIEATPETIWQVLVDFERYPEWNPFIVQARGSAHAGERIEVTLSLPEGSESSFAPTIIRCEAAQELRWLGHLWLRGLFDGEHFFKLVRLGERHTRL